MNEANECTEERETEPGDVDKPTAFAILVEDLIDGVAETIARVAIDVADKALDRMAEIADRAKAENITTKEALRRWRAERK